jgi:hypothetical protein
MVSLKNFYFLFAIGSIEQAANGDECGGIGEMRMAGETEVLEETSPSNTSSISNVT